MSYRKKPWNLYMVTVFINATTKASFHRTMRDALTLWGRHGYIAQIWMYNHGNRYKKPFWIAIDEFGDILNKPDKSRYEVSWERSGEYPVLEDCVSRDWDPRSDNNERA